VTDERPYANVDCPYCRGRLDPLPKANMKCPACGQPIYVRSGPDGLTYLLQETDLRVLEEAWRESRERQEYATKTSELGVDFDKLEAEIRSRDPGYSARDVWRHASNRYLLAALGRGDWFEVQQTYFARALDSADHDEPWAEVAREGFKAMLRRPQYSEVVEILACACGACARDNGLKFKVREELAAPRLPHEACEEGWCACDYIPVVFWGLDV
jgi:hypothetical protein